LFQAKLNIPLKVSYSFQFLRKLTTQMISLAYIKDVSIPGNKLMLFASFNFYAQFPTLPISSSSCNYFYLRHAFLKVVRAWKNQWR